VPRGWENVPSNVNRVQKKDYETMTFLWESEAFEPTRPSDLWYFAPRKGTMLQNEFVEIVDSAEFRSRINKNWRKNRLFRISIDKMLMSTIELMRERHLAVRDMKRPDWYFVEENASLLYMSLLAKHLAETDIDYTVPSTDWEEYENTIFHSDTEKHGFPSFNSEFIGIFPVPRDDVPVKDILRFRNKRKDKLIQFREFIDDLQKEISHARNETAMKRTLVRYKEKVENGRSDLNNAMKNSGIRTAFASFKSLIGIKSPALLETIGFTVANIPLTVAIPIVAGTAFIQVGYEWVDNRNKRTAELSKSPFSYLYHAKQEQLV
jgi:hypothetical protein